jgi:hypothetical protein
MQFMTVAQAQFLCVQFLVFICFRIDSMTSMTYKDVRHQFTQSAKLKFGLWHALGWRLNGYKLHCLYVTFRRHSLRTWNIKPRRSPFTIDRGVIFL